MGEAAEYVTPWGYGFFRGLEPALDTDRN